MSTITNSELHNAYLKQKLQLQLQQYPDDRVGNAVLQHLGHNTRAIQQTLYNSANFPPGSTREPSDSMGMNSPSSSVQRITYLRQQLESKVAQVKDPKAAAVLNTANDENALQQALVKYSSPQAPAKKKLTIVIKDGSQNNFQPVDAQDGITAVVTKRGAKEAGVAGAVVGEAWVDDTGKLDAPDASAGGSTQPMGSMNQMQGGPAEIGSVSWAGGAHEKLHREEQERKQQDQEPSQKRGKFEPVALRQTIKLAKTGFGLGI